MINIQRISGIQNVNCSAWRRYALSRILLHFVLFCQVSLNEWFLLCVHIPKGIFYNQRAYQEPKSSIGHVRPWIFVKTVHRKLFNRGNSTFATCYMTIWYSTYYLDDAQPLRTLHGELNKAECPEIKKKQKSWLAPSPSQDCTGYVFYEYHLVLRCFQINLNISSLHKPL